VNLIIIIAGVAGLLIAGYGFVTLTIGAARRRQYLDILLATGVVVLVAYLLVAYGDRLLR
jgi:hypothetical protein